MRLPQHTECSTCWPLPHHGPTHEATESVHRWLGERLKAKVGGPVEEKQPEPVVERKVRICRVTDCDSPATVTGLCRRCYDQARRGKSARNGPTNRRDDVTNEMLLQMRADGWSYERIARKVKMNPTTIHQRLNGRGMKRL